MKRKYIVIILCLLLLITGCKKKTTTPKEKKIEDVKWEVVEGEKVSDNPYEDFETDKYIDSYFITTYSDKVYKYLVPSDTKPSSVDYAKRIYTSSSMLISIDEISLDDVNEYLKKVVSDYKDLYDEVYVENKIINDNLFISHATNLSFSDGVTFYKDELNVYIHDLDEEWNIIKYTLLGSKMDDALINKLVNGISKEKDDSKLKNCILDNVGYKCTFKDLGEKNVEVDINKMNFNSVDYNGNDNYSLILGGNNGSVKLGILYYDDTSYTTGIENKLFNFNRLDDVTVNGRTYMKYVSIENDEDDEFRRYLTYYIYEINENTAFYYYVESSENNDRPLDMITNIVVQ